MSSGRNKSKTDIPGPIVVGFVRCRVETARHDRPNDQGQWYWRAQWKEDGKRRGFCMWATEVEIVQEVARRLGFGELKSGVKDFDKTITNVHDLMVAWVESVRADSTLRPGTVRAYVGSAERLCFEKNASKDPEDWLVRHIATIVLDELDHAIVKTHINRRLKSGGASLSIGHELTVLKMAWRWAIRVGRIKRRAIAWPKFKGEPEKPKYTPTHQELGRIFHQLGRRRQRWPLLLAWLFMATGARISEIALMGRDRVRFYTRLVPDPEDDTQMRSEPVMELFLVAKGGPKKDRRIEVLSPGLISVVRSHMASHDRDNILGVTPQTARGSFGIRYLKPICETLGIPYFTAHGLRRRVSHDLIVELIRGGMMDQLAYEGFMGHRLSVALESYAQTEASDRRRASVILSRRLSNVLVFEKRSTG